MGDPAGVWREYKFNITYEKRACHRLYNGIITHENQINPSGNFGIVTYRKTFDICNNGLYREYEGITDWTLLKEKVAGNSDVFVINPGD